MRISPLNGMPIITPLIMGSILAFFLLHQIYSDSAKTDFDNFALGPETDSYFAEVDGYPIHGKTIKDADLCINGSKSRELSKVALWLGNSQVHAINQFKKGQENAPPILFRDLQSHGVDLLTFSQPNANLQEHLVLFEYFKRLLNIKYLLLPIVFDDFRETGLRSGIIEALDDSSILRDLKITEIGQQIIAENEGNIDVDTDFNALNGTIQDRYERAINGWLEENSSLWSMRPEMRGQIITSLRKLRNTVFGIKPSSKRRIIKGRYKTNMAALESIINIAGAHGIKIFIYVVPIRHDVEIPYVDKEYTNFKTELERMIQSEWVVFKNYEKLIPNKYWGKKDATVLGKGPELDFMHFQAEGHKILAKELCTVFEKEFL